MNYEKPKCHISGGTRVTTPGPTEEEYKRYREHKERYLTGKVKYWHPVTGDPLAEAYKE